MGYPKREEIWAGLIPDLIRRSSESIQDVLKRHGIPRSTYYSRWLKHPEFQLLFQAEYRRFMDEWSKRPGYTMRTKV